MTEPVDYDLRRPVPQNHVFEAHDWHDPTNGFLICWRDPENNGVLVNFCSYPDANGDSSIQARMWINADQCEQFGNALLDAARIIRDKA